ncbi:hypothetical protein ABZP36_033844 [Zizania latifolia]
MKHNSNKRSSVAQNPSSVTDQCSPDGCDHRPALREIARGQSLVAQLRAIVLPALQADERCDLAAQMLEGILDCSRKAASELQLLLSSQARDDEQRRGNKVSSSDGCSSKADEANAKPLRQHKRRRFGDSMSLETPVPHYDGHQWRKYGQKHINNSKHPRCTYRQEEKCKATKTVQQQEDHYGNSNGDHPAMYTVVYFGQHTCCKGPAGDHVVVEASQVSTESQSQSQSQSSSSDVPPAHGDSSQCSNISVTCSSVVAEDRQASMESNKLLDMLPADDLTTDVLFDLAAYAPLDLDINWEMDAYAHSGFEKFGDW